MNRFDYVRPASVAEAIAAAAAPGAAYLAAGTNLLDLMKTGAARPSRLVDVTRLPGLDRIEMLPDGGARIGAMVRNADLARDRGFARAFPAVAEALLSGASPQLRNAATVGGNLMQRTRCAYFFDAASACNRRDPGAGCDAREGENRGHAILGWSDACIATHPSDFCVPLVALDASVEIEGPAGRRGAGAREPPPPAGPTPRARERARARRARGRPAPAAGGRAPARPFPLPQAPRAHLLRLRARLGRRRPRARGRRPSAAPASPSAGWRPGPGGRGRPRPCSRGRSPGARPSPAPPRRRSPTPGRRATTPRPRSSSRSGVIVRALLLAAAGTPEGVPALPASVLAETGAAAHA